MANKLCVTSDTSYIQNVQRDHPSPTPFRPELHALVVVSQVASHRVIVNICGTCNQSIIIYTVVVLATFVQVKV
jgi:hypothetical protein